MVRRIESRVGFEIRQPALGRSVPVRANLELWEYSGSLRYNFYTGALQPFAKLGYGASWYRLANARIGDEPFQEPRTPWVRKPSVFPPENLLPNTWHVGGGLEALPITSFAPFPKGLDVGIRASYAVYFHGLGLGRREILSEQEDVTLGRTHLNLTLTASF